MIHQALELGVVGQALQKNLFQLETVNPRDWATGIHKAVDDRPFGGGDGMVMSPEVFQKSLMDTFAGSQRSNSQKLSKNARVIHLTPQGKLLNEQKVLELSQCDHLVFLSGRYSGIDQRVLNLWVDEEVSIGDYVLSGGEFPALVAIDAIARKIPGVLGHGESASHDSLAEEGLLEEPQFTRPWEWNGQSVPEVLRSGNHQKIAEWKKNMSFLVTLAKRPDLLKEVSEENFFKLKSFYDSLSDADKAVCGVKNLSLFNFKSDSRNDRLDSSYYV